METLDLIQVVAKRRAAAPIVLRFTHLGFFLSDECFPEITAFPEGGKDFDSDTIVLHIMCTGAGGTWKIPTLASIRREKLT